MGTIHPACEGEGQILKNDSLFELHYEGEGQIFFNGVRNIILFLSCTVFSRWCMLKKRRKEEEDSYDYIPLYS